jgi:uncharacterized protein YndB with AHSA1/START domain
MKILSQPVVSHGSFSIERRYAASPERVWRAHEDSASFRRWFVEGEGFTVHEWEQDFRVGGRSRGRFRFGGDDQPTYFNETVHLDLVPGARIVNAYVMGRETADGPERFSASLATTELVADGTGTKLIYTEQGAFFGDREADGPVIRKQGWETLLDALATELAREG